MLPCLVTWYHEHSIHLEGMDRQELTIKRHFWHPQLRQEIRQQLSNCQVCARMKTNFPKHGQLAPQVVPSIPWSKVHCDQIEPWLNKVNGLEVQVRALTMVDPVTNLSEIVRVRSTKTAAFINTWLARYPLPEFILTNGGPEFTGHKWDFLLQSWGLTCKRISLHTPTANAIIESSHRSMGQIFQTIFDCENTQMIKEMDKVVEAALASTMRALRCAASTSLNRIAPGSLVFGRDMLMNIPIVTDIISISENQQLQTNFHLKCKNWKRSHMDYSVGQMVYIKNHFSASNKLKPAWLGPFRVLRVHFNGTLTIECGQIHKRLSI